MEFYNCHYSYRYLVLKEHMEKYRMIIVLEIYGDYKLEDHETSLPVNI